MVWRCPIITEMGMCPTTSIECPTYDPNCPYLPDIHRPEVAKIEPEHYKPSGGVGTSQPEEKIICPSKFGEKTRAACLECEYHRLTVCPIGMHFVRNEPGDRTLWEAYLVMGGPVYCPKCDGEYFTLRKVELRDRMLASAKLNVVCINCAYTESLYEIGGKKE